MRNKLPAEVLQLVFSFINYIDLFACQQVCRDWNQPARVLIYKTITPQTLFLFDKLLNSLQQNPSLGKLVRYVKLPNKKEQHEDWTDFNKKLVQFAKLCTGVERLVSDAVWSDESDFWKTCYFLCLTCWTRMVQLPDIHVIHFSQEYLRAAIACKDRLEQLELWQIPDQKPSFSTANMTKLVKEFKSLKSVKLCLCSYTDAIYLLDRLFNQCGPELTSICVKYFGVYRSVIQQWLQKQLMVTTAPIHSVKQLSIKKGHIDCKTREYIKYKFPQLSSIKLSYDYSPMEERYTNMEIRDIMEYVMGMESGVIKLTCKNHTLIPLAIVTQNIGAPLIALSIIYYERCFDHSPPVRFKIEHNKQQQQKNHKTMDPLQYEVKNKSNEYLPQPQFESTKVIAYCQHSSLALPGMQPPPHKGILPVIGPQLSYLYLNLQHYDSNNHGFIGYNTTTTTPSEYHLDSIFRLCPNLHTLAFSVLHLLECDPNFVSNKSIQHLAIFGAEISDTIFSQLSIRLPSLTCLQLTGCYIYNIKNDNEFNIDMPYTSFQWLSISQRHFSANKHTNPEVIYTDYFSRLYKITSTSFLSLATLQGEKYFKLERDKVISIPLLHVYRWSDNVMGLTKFHLRCKSIESISIVNGGLNITHLDPNISY